MTPNGEAPEPTPPPNRAARRRGKREHVFGEPLLESDFAAFERCAILRQHAEDMCRRVDSATGTEMFGQNGIGDCAGIVFLIRWPGVDQVREYLLRRDSPPVENGKTQRKYLWPPGRGNILLFPPRAAPEWLDDATLPIVFVEGPKKLLALWNLAWHGLPDSAQQPRFLPIAVSGVWNFRGRTGKQTNEHGERIDEVGVIGDFSRINFTGRESTIWYDRNVHDNPEKKGSVNHARNSFAQELRKLGASVRFCDLPAGDVSINGPDDYAGKYGLEATLELYSRRYDPKTGNAAYSAEAQPAGEGIRLTEERLAQEFESRYGAEMYYDADRGQWVIWDQQRGYWQRNRTGRAYHYARTTCRELNIKNAKEFARARTYGGVEQICQKSPIFAVTHEFWDRDIWLLGTPGGTVDLRCGELRPAQKDDHITKQTAISPDFTMEMPIFNQFLNQTTQGNEGLQHYLQRLSGYALTGSTREQKLFFFYGPGGNGKSVLVNTWATIAGDYHTTAPMDTFVEHRGERHPTDVAALAGARLLTASETQKGRQWDVALVNRLTGGDKVTARFMRRDFFEYTPQFTLIIVGNCAPELDVVNQASRRRFRIIPFTFEPATLDERLEEKLRPEWPAILAWMIEGARDWFNDGLGETPEVVQEETEDYFDEQGRLKHWADECTERKKGNEDTSANLYRSWQAWCSHRDELPGKQKTFISSLKKQFHLKPRKDRSVARGLKGIAVKIPAAKPADCKPDARTGERDD